MKLDFDRINETNDRVSVPAGTYVCRIDQIRERTTRAGDPLWGIRLVVAEGEFTGHTAAWDNLVFSMRGLNRVKLILKALGLPNHGTIDLATEDLLDREVLVEVRPSEYHSPEGQMTRRNEVPYEGYRPIPAPANGQTPSNGTSPAASLDDDLPF